MVISHENQGADKVKAIIWSLLRALIFFLDSLPPTFPHFPFLSPSFPSPIPPFLTPSSLTPLSFFPSSPSSLRTSHPNQPFPNPSIL